MRCLNLHIWTYVSVLCTAFIPRVYSDGRNLILKKLTNCKGFENSPLSWSDLALERDPTTKDFMFSLKLKVLKEVSTKFEMEFSLWKCDETGSLDSCEYFLKEYKNNNICNYIARKHQFWSIFIEHITPPLTCPIKPGEYSGKQIPLNSDFLTLLPIKDAVWKSRLRGFDEGQAISCVDVEMKVTTERRG